MIPVWEQYRRMAHLFARWSPEQRAAAKVALDTWCKTGVAPKESHWSTPQSEIRQLMQTIEQTNSMAIRMTLDGYTALDPEKVKELLARKMPGTLKRTGWR